MSCASLRVLSVYICKLREWAYTCHNTRGTCGLNLVFTRDQARRLVNWRANSQAIKVQLRGRGTNYGDGAQRRIQVREG